MPVWLIEECKIYNRGLPSSFPVSDLLTSLTDMELCWILGNERRKIPINSFNSLWEAKLEFILHLLLWLLVSCLEQFLTCVPNQHSNGITHVSFNMSWNKLLEVFLFWVEALLATRISLLGGWGRDWIKREGSYRLEFGGSLSLWHGLKPIGKKGLLGLCKSATVSEIPLLACMPLSQNNFT